MLETHMKEGITQVIELTEDSNLLRYFFRLMYLADSGEITLQECMALIIAADKYMIDRIHYTCSCMLFASLYVDNAVEILKFAVSNDIQELSDQALNIIGGWAFLKN